ncbi:hypothetical protein IAR55_002962 [Kwoniella newhampshirensis]|uniref:Derlin n=1 Tax=Kwoniella newhampshirensis TaxID=1651941 RepID=A0AAW0YQN7_9TREE
MSLQDRLASQDALQLLTTATSLALVTAGSTTGFSYNFPLMLFGVLAHELRSSTAPFRQFLILILFTGIFDIYALLFHTYSSLILLVSILLAALKVPVFFTCLVQLRERGGDLRWGEGGFGFRNVNLGGNPASNWTMPMPGGFAGGGQTTGSGPTSASNTAGQPANFPSSGGFRLGGDEEEGQGHATPLPPPGRGGYQTID